MLTLLQTNSKNKILVALMAIFLISFLGFMNLSMMNMDGEMSYGSKSHGMSNCPCMTDMSICSMIPFEHLSACLSSWLSMFTALPFTESGLQLLLLFSALTFSLIYFRHFLSLLNSIFNNLNSFSLTRRRFLEHQYFPTAYLQEAFSNGILNPKIF